MSNYPNILAGTRVTATLLNSMLPQEAYLSADTSAVNNSTTLVDADGLAVTLESGGVYRGGIEIYFVSPTAADIKFAYTVPGGSTGRHGGMAPSTGATTHNPTDTIRLNVSGAFGTAFAYGGVSTNHIPFRATFYIVAGDDGDFQVQFAQNTATVGDTIILTGSHLWVKRMA